MGNAMDREIVASLFQKYPMIADARPEEAPELSRQRLDSACSSFRVTMDGLKKVHGDMLRDAPNLGRNFRLETYSLHKLS